MAATTVPRTCLAEATTGRRTCLAAAAAATTVPRTCLAAEAAARRVSAETTGPTTVPAGLARQPSDAPAVIVQRCCLAAARPRVRRMAGLQVSRKAPDAASEPACLATPATLVRRLWAFLLLGWGAVGWVGGSLLSAARAMLTPCDDAVGPFPKFPVSGASRGGSSGPSLAVVTDTWQFAPVSELAEADPSLGHALVRNALRATVPSCTRFSLRSH